MLTDSSTTVFIPVDPRPPKTTDQNLLGINSVISKTGDMIIIIVVGAAIAILLIYGVYRCFFKRQEDQRRTTRARSYHRPNQPTIANFQNNPITDISMSSSSWQGDYTSIQMGEPRKTIATLNAEL
jgi:predicted membrane protein